MREIYLENSNKQVFQQMQSAGFNITTCGHCGAIRLHKVGVDELDCESCNFVSDICDFPDLFIVQEELCAV